MEIYIKCTELNREKCFGCKGDKCHVLRAYTKAQMRGAICPFYKTLRELQNEEKKLYGKVLHTEEGYGEEFMGC